MTGIWRWVWRECYEARNEKMAGDVSLVVSALWHEIFRLTGDWGELRGVRALLLWRGSDPLIFPPCRHERYRRMAKFWTPVRRVALKWQTEASLILSALRAWDFSPDRRLGRLRGVRP